MTIRQIDAAVGALILSSSVAACGAPVRGYGDGGGDGSHPIGDAAAFDAGPDAAPGAGMPCDLNALLNTQ